MAKAKKICETAIKAASGEYGAWFYRRDNNPNNYGAKYNVGTWYIDHWCSDCLGFVHIMVNGFYGDRNKVGGGALMDDFVWNSDEATTLNKYCSIRGSFPKRDMKEGSLLQSSGHVGLYVGDHGTFNTAECTTAKGGGAVLTWTDLATGQRFSQKGGYYISSWQAWGQFDRVDYSNAIDYPDVPFYVTVLIPDLDVRKNAGQQYESLGHASKGSYIVDTVKNDYGYVASLSGWIYLANDEWVKVGEHVKKSPFSDISIDDKNYKEISTVHDYGLMNGIKGKFKPNNKVTRRQMAIILYKLLKLLKK